MTSTAGQTRADCIPMSAYPGDTSFSSSGAHNWIGSISRLPMISKSFLPKSASRLPPDVAQREQNSRRHPHNNWFPCSRRSRPSEMPPACFNLCFETNSSGWHGHAQTSRSGAVIRASLTEPRRTPSWWRSEVLQLDFRGRRLPTGAERRLWLSQTPGDGPRRHTPVGHTPARNRVNSFSPCTSVRRMSRPW